MSWTDERVALLKKLWGEGVTAAEIAGKLGNVTRNAVIGKAHRLKLSGRASPIQQSVKPANSESRPAAEKPRKIQKAPEQNNIRVPEPKHEGPVLPLLELNARMCRWPIGDPQEEGFGFCGAPNRPGLPYCTEHAKVAYQAATRNRILQAEKAELEAATAALEAAERQSKKKSAVKS